MHPSKRTFKEALNKDVDIIAVACPYCYNLYAYALLTMETDLQVKAIAELTSEGL